MHILSSKTSSPLESAPGNVVFLGWLVDVDAGREGGIVPVGVRTGGARVAVGIILSGARQN